jgi:hypothetical protein
MAEKRSIPAALGIFIGPAIAYLSYLIFISGFNEFAQLACFALFLIAGHDLAESGISLSGTMIILLLPSIPIAVYLQQAAMSPENQLSPSMIIALWVASALLGAVLAGLRPPRSRRATNVTRLAIMASALLVLLVVTFILA